MAATTWCPDRGLQVSPPTSFSGLRPGFRLSEKALVVEVDGGQHQGSGSDKVRDQRLISAGFRILRFWNNDVLLQTDAVAEVIRGALLTPRVETLPVGWPHSWRDGEVLRLRSDSSMPAFCIAT